MSIIASTLKASAGLPPVPTAVSIAFAATAGIIISPTDISIVPDPGAVITISGLPAAFAINPPAAPVGSATEL